MRGKARLEAYLREAGVPFHAQRHPKAYTAREVAASEHLPGELVAKVVIVFADGRPVMLVLPATSRVDLDQAGRVIGANVARLAHEDELSHLFPDCEVGAMPPFGNLYDLPVYVDQELAKDEVIFFQAGTHVDTMSLSFADFARLVEPTIAAIGSRQGALTADTGG